MKTSELSKRRTLLFGLAAFVIGFLVFFNGREVTSLSISLVALYFLGWLWWIFFSTLPSSVRKYPLPATSSS